jgi:hypothetical protein
MDGSRAISFGDVAPTRCQLLNRPVERPLSTSPGGSNQNLHAGLPVIDAMKKKNAATPSASMTWPKAAPTATTSPRKIRSDRQGRRNLSMLELCDANGARKLSSR